VQLQQIIKFSSRSAGSALFIFSQAFHVCLIAGANCQKSFVTVISSSSLARLVIVLMVFAAE